MHTHFTMKMDFFTDPDLLSDIARYGREKMVPRDTVLIAPGAKIVFVPIVLSGVLRIVRQNEDGQEVFLYHLYPGQTCAMAINCCQAERTSMIKAIAEDNTTVVQVPADKVEDWKKYPEWKTFINNTYAQRFAELLEVVDLVAFSNMDKQLLHYLAERCRAMRTRTLAITHLQIAEELHTHREAISRLLRTMEQKKLVRLGRNTIELLTDHNQ